MEHNLPMYLEGYDRCEFYDSIEAAKIGHDIDIMEYADQMSTNDRERMYAKLYDTTLVKRDLRQDAKEWYKTLLKTEESYVEFFIQEKLKNVNK